MTYKEAFNRIREYELNACWGASADDYIGSSEFVQITKKALEKQVPKKPIDNHHCPSCETGLPHKGFTDEWCKCCFELDYCPRCGQAIDWR